MSNAIARFEDFWRRMPISGGQTLAYVHPDDDKSLTKRDRECMRLNLLPLPVNGNLRTADVVILMLNPGFGERDALWGTPASRSERLAGEHANLHQSHWSSDYPFFDLDPALAGSGGANYWAGPIGPMKGKLGHLAKALASSADSDHAAIRKELSNRVAIVQLVAYRSKSFRNLFRLESSQEALQLAQGLVSEGDKLIVVPYGIQRWDFPTQVTKRLVVYRHGLRQAHFAPTSPGHQAVLEALHSRSGL